MENVEFIWSLIEGTNDLVQTIKPDGSLEFVNGAWLDTMKYVVDETDELTIDDVIFPGAIGEFKLVMSHVLNGERIVGFKTILVSKDGEQIPVEANIFPRYDGKTIVAIEGFYRDVSARQKAEQELGEERSRAEFFIDLMTHDLTNINQEILSTLEILLLDQDLPSQSQDLVIGSLKEVERAANLIANVKRLSEMQRKKPERKKLDPAVSLHIAIDDVKKSFPEKELIINSNLDHNHYLVDADDYLGSIFQSLLHNAMKYDDKKRVVVDVEVEPIKHTPFLRFQFKDHGRGIPDDEKEEIFARLAHRRDGILGLGLGLTLVKQVIENYGGQIMVKDRVEGNHSKGANLIVLLRYEPLSNAKRDD